MTQLYFSEQKTTLDKVRPGPYQTRRNFDRQKMAELVQTIQGKGLINPPIVFAENGHYCLLAGERRSRALCALAIEPAMGNLEQAIDLVCREDAWDMLTAYPSLSSFEVTLRVAPKAIDLEDISLIENIQRADLNPIEEGEAYSRLLKKYGTLSKVARVTGRSGGLIKSRIQLLDLEKEIQQYIISDQLSKDQQVIDALLSLPTTEVRLQLAKRFVEKRAPIKTIVVACQKTRGALEQAAKAEKLKQNVPVKQAVIVPQVTANPATPAPHCFCPECTDLIKNLAEELCGSCLVDGFSASCLHCPGVIEFIETLVDRANCHA